MSGLYLKFGSYQHEANECAVVIARESVQSPDGVQSAIRERWSISGRLQKDTQAELTTAIRALEAAYSTGNKDVGLHLSTGAATAHGVLNRQTVRGTRVTQPPSFPEGAGAEYSTFRNYTIGLEWEIPDPTTSLLSWAESITFEGTGGPNWGFLIPLVGPPQQQMFSQASEVRAVQSGRAIGNGAYPTPPPPIWPAFELGPARRVAPSLPSFRSNEREISWSYTFLFPGAVGGYPGGPR